MSAIDHLAALATLLLITAGLVYLATLTLSSRLTRQQQNTLFPIGMEQRRYQRYPVARVVAVLSGSPPERARVQDISLGGMRLDVGNCAVQAGAIFKTALFTPGRRQPLEAEARAVWISGGCAGFEFLHVDPDLRRWIEAK